MRGVSICPRRFFDCTTGCARTDSYASTCSVEGLLARNQREDVVVLEYDVRFRDLILGGGAKHEGILTLLDAPSTLFVGFQIGCTNTSCSTACSIRQRERRFVFWYCMALYATSNWTCGPQHNFYMDMTVGGSLATSPQG